MSQFSLKSLLVFAASAAAKIYYAGVAQSGGENGVWSATSTKGTGLPGVFGVDYQFINTSAIDIWVNQNKINVFRIAFLLERMCPPSGGLGSTFDETYFGHFQDAVNYVTQTKGVYAILDAHNYMRYNDPSHQPWTGSIIGDTTDPNAATTAQFGAFWQELASRFVSNPKVIFAVMNEPHYMPTSLVIANNQAAINGIRATGAQQLTLVAPNSWASAHAFNQTNGDGEASSEYMMQLTDSANNMALDIHEYLDSDFSGSHSVCSQAFPANLWGLTQWLKTNNMKAFVTEFGGSNSTTCPGYLQQAVAYMNNNPQYIGWTIWAAGPTWGIWSPCCTDENQWGSLEPGSLAGDGSPGLYYTVWVAIMQHILPTKYLQRSGMTSVNGPSGPAAVAVQASSAATTVASTSTATSVKSSSITTSVKVTSTTASSAKATTTVSSASKASTAVNNIKTPKVAAKASTSTTTTKKAKATAKVRRDFEA